MSPFDMLPDCLCKYKMKPRGIGGLVVNAGLIFALPLFLGGTASAAGKLKYNRDEVDP